MTPKPVGEASDPFLLASSQAREVIDAARDAQESARATRRRLRLRSLILSWRGRGHQEPTTESERLALILDIVRAEASAPMGNIQVFEDGVLCIRAAFGLSDAFLSHFAEVRPGQCCCGAAYRNAAPVVVDDVRTSALFKPSDRDMLLDSGISACQSLALAHRGHTLGVISLHYPGAIIPLRLQTTFAGLAGEIAEAVSLAMN